MSDAERIGVLCLGASAGGLRSLEAVLSNLPVTFPWPILISQHLQREHVSLMPGILSRATKIPVREAKDGETPLPGVAYTCPSSSELGLSPDGRLTLREPVEGRPQRIDHLFSTASFARPGLVIAVILSGTGSDGTAGSLVVKLNGGTVIVENEDSAQQSAMPRAAQKAGTVDAARPADAIAPLLMQLAEGGLDEMTQAMGRDVAAIAKTLSDGSRTDFTRYRPATLRRRIEKRRALVGAPNIGAYHDLLRRDAAERGALTKSLLLPVTEFFRDPAAWDTLAEHVVPPLVAQAQRSGATIRIWCAGCASGEEAYSLAIVFAEAGLPVDQLEVLATDLDDDSLARAKDGAYDAPRMANVSAERRARFFTPHASGLRVTGALRDAIEFRAHDLTSDVTPTGPFDLVACRNVLIYFDDALQADLVRAFESTLAPHGILFLGRSSAVPPREAFEPVARSMRIFRAHRTKSSALPPSEHAEVARTDRGHAAPDATPRTVDALLVDDPTSAILVVDASWRVTLVNRRARDLAKDAVGKDLLDVFPRWQGSPVHNALRDAMATGRGVRVQGVPMAAGFVELTIDPVPAPGGRQLFLVAQAAPSAAAHASAPATREDQQLLREDLAATNDELQTANEELAAANEELQATNEELASLNEEFLNTNQNLASTNAEMSASIEHTRPSSALLHAIVRARLDASIVCDPAGRVTLVTKPAMDRLGLDASAIGAGIEELGLGIEKRALAVVTVDGGASRALTASGRLVTLEPFAAPDGTLLGWLLTWRDA